MKRGVLIGCLIIPLVCICVCGIGIFAVGSQDSFTIGLWGGTVGSPETLDAVGVVCDGSQALAFSDSLVTQYGEGFTVTMGTITEQGDDYVADVTIEGETEQYLFVMGSDAGFLGVVGKCISEIRAV